METTKWFNPHFNESKSAQHFQPTAKAPLRSLSENLRNMSINDIVICGAMSHMCIDATTRAPFDLGFNCAVAEDAMCNNVHTSFMAALSFPYA
ncbi:MAG TPA: isochorismatase family protein [Deltaproteobacteria bacterium]|nr:isochorismatase family protein [Deltaproteobacteria bacterium]